MLFETLGTRAYENDIRKIKLKIILLLQII